MRCVCICVLFHTDGLSEKYILLSIGFVFLMIGDFGYCQIYIIHIQEYLFLNVI